VSLDHSVGLRPAEAGLVILRNHSTSFA